MATDLLTALTVLSCRHTELFSDKFDEEIANSTVDVEHTIGDCDDCAVFLGDVREVQFNQLSLLHSKCKGRNTDREQQEHGPPWPPKRQSGKSAQRNLNANARHM